MAQFWAIIGAIKQIASIFKILKRAYDTYKDAKIHKHYEQKRQATQRVNAQIEEEVKKPIEEQNDEKLKDLHRRLVNLGVSRQ